MCRQAFSRAMLGCGLWLLVTAFSSAQQPEAKQPPSPSLPEGLRHVPPDAMAFIHFRAGDFLKSAAGKALLQELRRDREASKGLKKIEETLSLEATDIESVTLVMLTPPSRLQMNGWDVPPNRPIYKERFPEFDFPKKREMKFPDDKKIDKGKFEDKKPEAKKADPGFPVLFQEGAIRQPFQVQDIDGRILQVPDMDPLWDVADQITGPLVIVSSTKPLDRKKILRAQLFTGRARDIFAPAMSQEPSVLFLSDRTVMLGAAWELARYSELMARKPGPKAKPMQSALALGAHSHVVVAGGYLPSELRRIYFSPFVPEMRAFAPVAPLFQSEAGLALDLGDSVDLTLQFSAPNEASAANTLQAVKSLRVLAELGIEKSREGGESGGAKLEMEKALIKALANATIEQKGLMVRAELKLELGPAFYKKFTKDIVAMFRQRGDRAQSVNNLKQIGIALHGHHDAYKKFPPAGIGDRDGKPLLSWRVKILPYIEQGNLYQQFDLNQPWDHPANKKLIARMPAIYAVPGAETKEGMTHYRVLVGGGAMFEPRMGISVAQVTDGTSNTFMVVEAKEPTIWTQPDDLPYDPKAALPKFGVWPEGFNALFADGSVRFIRSTTPEEHLRAYITRSGGEVVPTPDY